MQTRELEYLAQVLNDGEHPAIAGEFLHLPVELLIDLEKGSDAPVTRGRFET